MSFVKKLLGVFYAWYSKNLIFKNIVALFKMQIQLLASQLQVDFYK